MARLKNIRLVLVGTRSPGNLGACARLCANFGLQDTYLVSPLTSPNHPDAMDRAVGKSLEVLKGFIETTHLVEAVQDLPIAIGFSRRKGKWRKPNLPFEQLAQLALGSPTALVFGDEKFGLSEEALNQCTHLCYIPTEKSCESLNLSHAVSIALTHLYHSPKQHDSSPHSPIVAGPKISGAEMTNFLSHWWDFLEDAGMNRAGNPDRIVQRLQKFFSETALKQKDVALFRAILSKTQVALGTRARGKRIIKT